MGIPDESEMRVGILGGTFNPPHIGHAIMARTVLESGHVDEVWVMPAKQNPMKNLETSASNHDRGEMVEMMVAEMEGGIFYSSFELDQTGDEPSYSYSTLHKLSAKFPHHQFKWIVGLDCLYDLGKEPLRGWKNGKELVQEFGIIVLERKITDCILGDYRNAQNILTIPNSPIIDISSTQIRERVREGKSIRFLVPECVEEYIKQNKLYEQND